MATGEIDIREELEALKVEQHLAELKTVKIGLDLLRLGIDRMRLLNDLAEGKLILDTEVKHLDLRARLELIGTKATGSEGKFVGMAAIFNEVDLQGDKILPGAFRESIARSRGTFPMLWSHKADLPIGVVSDVREDSLGLAFTGNLVMSVEKAREARDLLKAGAIDGVSIGYRIPEGGAKYRGDVRELLKVDLIEISVVTFPAQFNARVDRSTVKYWL